MILKILNRVENIRWDVILRLKIGNRCFLKSLTIRQKEFVLMAADILSLPMICFFTDCRKTLYLQILL